MASEDYDPTSSDADDGKGPPRKDKGKTRTYKGTTKLEVAREELTYVIRELRENVYFNILSYNTEVEGWTEFERAYRAFAAKSRPEFEGN